MEFKHTEELQRISDNLDHMDEDAVKHGMFVLEGKEILAIRELLDIFKETGAIK